jgi:hypothetical protein
MNLRVLFFLFFCTSFGFKLGAGDYYVPEVLQNDSWQTYVGILNPGRETVTLEITGYNSARKAVVSETLTELTGWGYGWYRVSELFPEVEGELLWLVVHSDSALNVIVELQGPGTRSSYIADQLYDEVYMPHLAKNTGTFTTTLSSINGSGSGITTVLMPKPEGSTKTVLEHSLSRGKSRNDVLNYWSDLSNINWVKMNTGSQAVAAMEYFTYNQENRMAALGLNQEKGHTLRFLHVATDTANFWTGMVYLNISDDFEANTTETYFNSTGHVINTHSETVPAGGKVTLLFDANNHERVPAGTAWVKVDSNINLVGYEIFGSVNGGNDQTFAGIQGNYSGMNRLNYPLWGASDNVWTGYIAVNIGDVSANLNFFLIDAQGNEIASATRTDVAPATKTVILGSDLFPDTSLWSQGAWVRMDASQSEWAGFVLRGDHSGAIRDNLSGVSAFPADNDNIETRVVLVENFSASYCGPCGALDRSLEGFWEDNPPSVMAFIRYGAWSNDPYYTNFSKNDMTTRANYYHIQGVPTVWVDGVFETIGSVGGAKATFEQQIEERGKIDTGVKINLAVDFSAGKVDVTVNVTGSMPTGSNRLRVAVIEKEYTFSSPPGNNGVVDYHGNMLQMLPNATGTLITAGSGGSQDFSFSYSPGNLDIHPPTGFAVIAWVQNDSNKNVLASIFKGQ